MMQQWAAGDELTAAKLNQTGVFYGADAQGSDAYVLTPSPAISAYVDGMEFSFKANTANTGNATLNVNSKGAKNILKQKDQTLANNDIKAGSMVKVIYDSSQDAFQMVSPTAQASATPTIMTHAGFEKAERYEGVTTGSGAIAYGQTGVDVLISDGATKGSAYVNWHIGDDTTNFQVFGGTPVWTARFAANTIGLTSQFIFCLGLLTMDSDSVTYTGRHIGFKIVGDGATKKLYATVANGTTETATELATLVSVDEIELYLAVGASSVDFYYRRNGGALSAVTTISTNLPSSTYASAYIQAGGSSAGAAVVSRFRMQSMTYQR